MITSGKPFTKNSRKKKKVTKLKNNFGNSEINARELSRIVLTRYLYAKNGMMTKTAKIGKAISKINFHSVDSKMTR